LPRREIRGAVERRIRGNAILSNIYTFKAFPDRLPKHLPSNNLHLCPEPGFSKEEAVRILPFCQNNFLGSPPLAERGLPSEPSWYTGLHFLDSPYRRQATRGNEKLETGKSA
jgi:hypothetical protein